MSDIKMEDIVEKADPTSEPAKEVETEAKPEVTTEQDPLKVELERVQKSGKTEKEKAEFSLKKNAERVKALGGDPNSILGIEKEEPTDDDDQPVTMSMLRRMQQETASKSALERAEEIPNETERELTKWHLQNTIKSTGNPSKDFELATTLVNAVKNKQILEEVARKTPAKTHSSGSGGPVKADETLKGELTPEETMFTQKPFNLTKEQILKARKK